MSNENPLNALVEAAFNSVPLREAAVPPATPPAADPPAAEAVEPAVEEPASAEPEPAAEPTITTNNEEEEAQSAQVEAEVPLAAPLAVIPDDFLEDIPVRVAPPVFPPVSHHVATKHLKFLGRQKQLL